MEPNYYDYNYQAVQPQGTVPRAVWLKLLGVLAVIVAIVALWWVGTHSTIKISATDSAGGSGSYTYTLVDGSGKSSTTTSTDSTITKRVGKGTFQVRVTRGDTSYVGIATTKPFLRTTELTASLKPESSRTFVGTNPDACMYYASLLVSGPCGASLDQLRVHVAATAVTPSYTDNLPLGDFNTSSTSTQIIQTKSGWLGLTTQQTENDDRPAGYYLLSLKPDFSVGTVTPLKDLLLPNIYDAKPYKDGLLAITTAGDKAYYIASVTATPTPVAIDKATNAKYTNVTSIETDGDTITVQYSDQASSQNGDDESGTATVAGHSEIVVVSGSSQRHYSFNKAFVSAQTCGTDKLCALTNDSLEVYDISGSHPKLLYRMAGTLGLARAQGQLLVISAAGVTAFDPDSRSGYMNYSFGKYQYCGSSPASGGYLLCVLDAKGARQALYVNLNEPNTTNIDKRVYDLPNTPNITGVSVYGNYIFVTPDYGPTTHDWNLRTDVYNPATVQSVNSTLSQALAKAGLDKLPFVIINTATAQ